MKADRRNWDSADRQASSAASKRWADRLVRGLVRLLPPVGMLLLGTLLLTLSFAPMGQFYLAWFGLVPWLLVVRKTRNAATAFLWSWLAGLFFFTANMWWLWGVTGPGMVALMGLLGLYWAATGIVVRAVGFIPKVESADVARSKFNAPRAIYSILAFALIWTGFEWTRGNWPLHGLPWLFLGHTQSPLVAMCQVADLTGVYGVSFWVATINLLIALAVVHRKTLRAVVPAAGTLFLLTGVLLSYGIWRMAQSAHVTSPGPTVLVVQPNFPQSNTGEKGASLTDMVGFHIRTTRDALALRPGVDLVVWSETMMPEFNYETRRANAGNEYGAFVEEVIGDISRLCVRGGVGLVAGATFGADYRRKPDIRYPVPADRRNSAYFFDRAGELTNLRYDKIHIVPFGEYLPFQSTIPPLYRLFVSLSPYGEEYTLRPGTIEGITHFALLKSAPATAPAAETPRESWRFVTPICFEDIDPALVARMFRGADGTKAADLIINITNDGWFQFNEMPQHLQAAIFRSIENRVPTARSVNTGISGFIDSTGRSHHLVPAGTEGVSQWRVEIDSRYTFYTRHGDLFGIVCAIATALLAGAGFVRWWVSKRSSPSSVLAA